MRAHWLLSFGLASLIVGSPLAASALSETYGFTSGSVGVTVDISGSPVGSGSIGLDGNFMQFDPAIPRLDDLELTASNQVPFSIDLGVFSGYDSIEIVSLVVEQPVGGFTTSFGFGSNPYTVTVGPVAVSGTANITDADAILPPLNGLAFSTTLASLTGTITLMGGPMVELAFTGVGLGSLDPDGPLGPIPSLNLKGDFSFTGVVPEPGTALLLGIGCLVLARRARRPIG